jgi:anti-sigma regulatory factor (Ser/Thr protein kinase)
MRVHGKQVQRRHAITEASGVGEARRDAQRLAGELGLDETTTGKIGIVVTELGNNLVRHAGGGEILLQGIETDEGHQVEALAIDRGPGMADVDRCLQDGYSTGGTAGTGLGAVKRLSAVFDIYSRPGKGCAIMARVGAARNEPFGAICIAVAGETVCGDAWSLALREDEFSIAVFDGLGHGPLAAEASTAATALFAATPFEQPKAMMERAHQRLAGSRGAAGACAHRSSQRVLRYCGVGNICGRSISADKALGLVSHNGTLGVLLHRAQEFEYAAPEPSLLVMHSDGLSARWNIDQHEGLRFRHPGVIAAVLYREHARARDDATVVVVGHG